MGVIRPLYDLIDRYYISPAGTDEKGPSKITKFTRSGTSSSARLRLTLKVQQRIEIRAYDSASLYPLFCEYIVILRHHVS